MFPTYTAKSCLTKSEERYFPSSWSENSLYESINDRSQYSPYYNQSPKKEVLNQSKNGIIKPQPISSSPPPYEQCYCTMCISYKSYYNTLQWPPCREAGCPCQLKSYPACPNYQYFPTLSQQIPYQRSSLFTSESLRNLDESQIEAMNSSYSSINYPDHIKEMNNLSKTNSYIHVDTEINPSTSPKRPILPLIEQSPGFSSSSSLCQTSPDDIQLLKSIDPIECSTAHRQDATNKPPYSYITLIVSAMRSKPSRKITLNEIYSWIMANFAYYRRNIRRWQNSIRHALSFNDCFIKVPRPSGEAGKGNYWTVHPNAIDMFENGSTMRRNRKFIDSSKEGLSPKRRRTSFSKSPSTIHSTNSSQHNVKNGSLKELDNCMTKPSEVCSQPEIIQRPQPEYRFPPSIDFTSGRVDRECDLLVQQSLNLCHNDYSGSYRSWSESQLCFPISSDVC